MADVTINQLTTKSSLDSTNYLPISDGSTTTKLGTNSFFGFRNYIINGDFRIDQRNAGNSVVVNTGGPSIWTGPDRFFAYQNSPSTNVTIQRQTINTPSSFQYALKWGRTGSGNPGGITVLASALETDQSIPLAGKPVTLSFYAAKGANFSQQNSQLGVILISGTGIDQGRGEMVTFTWTGVTRPVDTNVTLTTGWQRFTLTANIPANCSQLGVYFHWTANGIAGADDNVYITGIQLEEGVTATLFERRPVGIELSLCQRYYEKSYNLNAIPGTGSGGGFFYQRFGYSGTETAPIMFKVTKRGIPNVTLYSPFNGAAGVWRDYSLGANRSVVTGDVGDSGMHVLIYSNSGGYSAVGGHWVASAEL